MQFSWKDALLGITIVVTVGLLGWLLIEKRSTDELTQQLASAHQKLQGLPPYTDGFFDPKNAVVGEKFMYDSWIVSSVDSATGDVRLTPAHSPAVVTGLFYHSQDSGPCLEMEQVGLESGTLPDVVDGNMRENFCIGISELRITEQFGAPKSYSWASVEVEEIRYTEPNPIASIAKVRNITNLKHNVEQ